MTGRVLVIGATGTVGRMVAAGVAAKGLAVRGATRNPHRPGMGGQRVEYVTFDLEQPETFGPALAGVERVFLVARPGDEEPQRVAVPLIDEMKRQGVRLVVNLTAMGVEGRNAIGLRQVEQHLENSGIEFVHLRPNWFMQIFAAGPLLADIRRTGAIHMPAGDARISYIDGRDVAEMAVATLCGIGYGGSAYTLTGCEALDHHAVVRAISQAAGREVRYVAVTEDEARVGLRAAGLPDARVERLIGFYRLVREGLCAAVTGDVERVLGRPAIRFPIFAKDHATLWR